MLGEFLDRMFGEDAKATANDTTANQVLINSQKGRKRNTPGLFPSLIFQLVSATCFLSVAEISTRVKLKATAFVG